MATNIFYIYDKVTGEYIGKRETSTQLPIWQPGVEAVRETLLPSNVRNKVKTNPEHFKRTKGSFVELGKKEKDKIKRNHTIDVG